MQFIQGACSATFRSFASSSRMAGGPSHITGGVIAVLPTCSSAGARRACHAKCVLRHLRVPPAGHRPAREGDSIDNILFGSEMMGAGARSIRRTSLRRYQSGYIDAVASRGCQAPDLRAQRPTRISAAGRVAQSEGPVKDSQPTISAPTRVGRAFARRRASLVSAHRRAPWTRIATCSDPAPCFRMCADSCKYTPPMRPRKSYGGCATFWGSSGT